MVRQTDARRPAPLQACPWSLPPTPGPRFFLASLGCWAYRREAHEVADLEVGENPCPQLVRQREQIHDAVQRALARLVDRRAALEPRPCRRLGQPAVASKCRPFFSGEAAENGAKGRRTCARAGRSRREGAGRGEGRVRPVSYQARCSGSVKRANVSSSASTAAMARLGDLHDAEADSARANVVRSPVHAPTVCAWFHGARPHRVSASGLAPCRIRERNAQKNRTDSDRLTKKWSRAGRGHVSVLQGPSLSAQS